jgi:ADP-ribose pyrophosphatase
VARWIELDLDIGDHRTLSSDLVFEGGIIKVFQDDVRLPDGRRARWDRVSHPGAVGMVPVTEDGLVVLVRQFRQAVDGVLLEIPAGKLDRNETPEACAQRELVEEVGFRAEEMVKLTEFYNSPGYSDEYFHLFLARELSAEAGEAEPDEFLEIEAVKMEKALNMIATGDIRDAKSIIGLALTRLFLEGEVIPYSGEPEDDGASGR